MRRTLHFCFPIFYLSLPTIEDFHKRNCNRGREIATGRDIACPTSFLSLPNLKGGAADIGLEGRDVSLNPTAD